MVVCRTASEARFGKGVALKKLIHVGSGEGRDKSSDGVAVLVVLLW